MKYYEPNIMDSEVYVLSTGILDLYRKYDARHKPITLPEILMYSIIKNIFDEKAFNGTLKHDDKSYYIIEPWSYISNITGHTPSNIGLICNKMVKHGLMEIDRHFTGDVKTPFKKRLISFD